MLLSKLLFLNLGGGEIFVILLVVLLFFGSKRIPDLAKGLGKGMREFKDAMSGIENEVRNAEAIKLRLNFLENEQNLCHQRLDLLSNVC